MEIGASHGTDASLPMEVHYESAGKCLKINDKSGAGIENNAVVSTTQVGGGGRSLERTRLWLDFPV